MKTIPLPATSRKQWITGVTDEALPALLIDLCLKPRGNKVHFVCFENNRTLNSVLQEVEALLTLPTSSNNKLQTVELPFLEEFRHLDSVLLDKLCDVNRTLSLIKDSQKSKEPVLIFTTPPALHQDLPSLNTVITNTIEINCGETRSFEAFKDQLATELNYSFEAVCEQPGQFAVRGGLIDVYPVNELTPYRIDFFGDEIDNIKSFDPTTQLTDTTTKTIQILPAIDSGSGKENDDNNTSILSDYLTVPCNWYFRNSQAVTTQHQPFFTKPERIKDPDPRKIDRFWLDRDVSQKDKWFCLDEITLQTPFFALVEPDLEPKCLALSDWAKQPTSLPAHTDTDDALKQSEIEMLRKLHKAELDGFSVYIGVSKVDEKERYETLLSELFGEKTTIQISVTALPKGIVFHNTRKHYFPSWLTSKNKKAKGLILVSEADLHPYLRIRLGRKNQRKAVEISQVDQMLDFTELSDGDLLVHQLHGICIFRGIQVLDFTSNRESLSLEFAEGSMLHLPLTESHLLTRYIGLSKRTPKLGKFGTNQWEKERKAAEKATLDLAAELLALQAKRDVVKGFSFPPDDEWMIQFEKAFPYNETPDQLTAIHQCKHDMEHTRPMDRLICGDVGFGKTEVAMRAAFKALEGGKQVAVLVPTTVLCQQHYHSFRERMAPFPVKIDTVSGFRTPAEQNKILTNLKIGKVDLIVGTHRLLSKDIKFNDLGLFIVDEEHRFGVKQKERLKQIATSVDVLTLSATPIPRTLYMALAGARDLSVIETPPRNRRPIETVVRNYDTKIVDSAIRTEVSRGGQVFYLHNRVSTIDQVAALINERNPELRVVVGHGQMERNDLEHIMTRFVNGDFDVMVCTTIIESGLDIPNCNTLIIEGADKFGLAQLYQIRGRVGRFNRQAYAYLLLHGKKPVESIARKRLSAIKQHNELGAGYRIAMRDLELRGAGNILGSAQSGHIAGVGFELYCRLLKQSISQFRDGISGPITRTTVNLDFAKYGEPPADVRSKPSAKEVRSNYHILKASGEEEIWVHPIYAHIPKKFIHETKLRIEFYRKLASAAEIDEVKTIRTALSDRFGKIPDETDALIRISAIRCLAESKKIASVEAIKGKLMIKFSHTGPSQYHKTGTHFPRLTKKSPLLLLNDCLTYLSKL